MAQFEGGNKVRCIDCTKLSGKTCTAKSTSVAVKKRRTCGVYEFKGEYVNSTPLPATYVPHVDKKTKKLMKQLARLGVMPMDGRAPLIQDGPYGDEEQKVVNPAAFSTTATAQIPVVRELESVGEGVKLEVDPELTNEDTTVVWSPEDGEKTEE
jgi:hypothetical protein